MSNNKGLGTNQPIFFDGIVEDRNDPLQLGRVRVRVFGIHSDSVSDIPSNVLPWASVILPANNASMSGLGWSPTGIVEGTMVRVYFADGTDFQKPVVIGTVPGINLSSTVSTSSNSSVVTPANPSVETQTNVSAALEQTDGWILGQTSEKYEIRDSTGSGFILNDVNDTRGKQYGPWLISLNTGDLKDYVSNHTSYVDTFKGVPIGSAEFDQRWKSLGSNSDSQNFREDQKTYMRNTHYAILLRNVTDIGLADRGNGVQDCIWSVSMEYGPDTKIIHEALNGKQISNLSDADVVTLVQLHRRNQVRVIHKSSSPATWIELEKRTDDEKLALLALCDDKQTAESKSIVAPSKDIYGQYVYKPVDLSKSASTVSQASFRDPSGKYPTKLYKGLPDTNRLARNYKSNTTIVKVKQNSTIKGNGFVEPTTKYSAVYPFNKVFESESGHIMEFDDTEGAERVHIYHRAGTFIEFHPDGTIVRKSMKDDVEIVVANKSCYIIGDCNVMIEGDSNVKVMGSMNAQVKNNIDFKAGGSISMTCNGPLKLSSAADASLIGGSVVSMIGPTMNFNTGSASAVSIDIGAKVNAELALADEDVPPGPEDDSTEFTTDADSVYMPAKNDMYTVTSKIIAETKATIDEELETFSKHYKLADLTTNVALQSQRNKVVDQCGLSSSEIEANLQTLARYCLDPIADKFGKDAFIITNAFRLSNGTTSHHLSGCAVDLQFAGMDANEYPHVAEQIRQMLPAFTQIILEYHGNNPLIHIGYARDKQASPFSRISGNIRDVFTTYDARFTRFKTSAGKGGFFDRNRNLVYEVGAY